MDEDGAVQAGLAGGAFQRGSGTRVSFIGGDAGMSGDGEGQRPAAAAAVRR
jgi:hypothetical protein